jgi:pseudouridine-5'-phosphate glycosidase
MLIANPILEADALDSGGIETTIAAAVAEAGRQGIGGKALTPFLLQRIFELTGGKSLAANIALVRNNARLAADIAVELAALAPARTMRV